MDILRFFLSRLMMNTVMNLKSFVSNFQVRYITAKSLKYKFLRADFFLSFKYIIQLLFVFFSLYDFIFFQNPIKCFFTVLLERPYLDFKGEVWPRDSSLEVVSLQQWFLCFSTYHPLEDLLYTHYWSPPSVQFTRSGLVSQNCISNLFQSDTDATVILYFEHQWYVLFKPCESRQIELAWV